jgi:hypothetical protein
MEYDNCGKEMAVFQHKDMKHLGAEKQSSKTQYSNC